MNLVPLGKRVIIAKPQPPAENKTSAGLLLSMEAEAKNEGEIIAIGEDVKHVLTGDIVIYPEYGAIELEEDGQALLIIDEADLVAVRTPVGVLKDKAGE